MKKDLIRDLLVIVETQSLDMGLWGFAKSPEEEYLQRALRDLHYAVERIANEILEEE
jgi:hypothetical protein